VTRFIAVTARLGVSTFCSQGLHGACSAAFLDPVHGSSLPRRRLTQTGTRITLITTRHSAHEVRGLMCPLPNLIFPPTPM
jgi:hypothetical protein